jgi:hypothetical protein
MAGAEDDKLRRRLDRLDEHLHLPSADQSALLGEVVRQLVLHEDRLVRAQRLPRLAERIALVAAAADRANHPPVGMDQHLRADPLRRRSARGDNRHQRNRLALRERLTERSQQFRGHRPDYTGRFVPLCCRRGTANTRLTKAKTATKATKNTRARRG